MSNQPRVPAGVRTGGRFVPGARPESDAQLAPRSAGTVFPRSADRDNRRTWQHPDGVARAAAITSYDDEAGWAVIGEGLRVTYPRPVHPGWIDTARPVLAQLHVAGLHGAAVAHTSGMPVHTQRDTWTLDVDLPSGRVLHVRGSNEPDRWVTFVGPGERAHAHVAAPRTFAGLDQGATEAALDAMLRLHDVHEAWRELAPQSGVDWRSSRPAVSLDEGAVLLRIDAAANSGPDTLVTIDDTGARITAVGQSGAFEPVEHDRDQLARFASRIGIRGGRRAGAGERARVLLERAAAAASDGPALTAVRGHRRRVASLSPIEGPHIYPA
ncbi:hypothetical protein HF998_02145 [Cellulomonas hominis]|nr:hypothetical protein [Cellulomonas hominis]MBB5474662.1 hypothetical protein [Cellulomonas hominis]NKY05787.1 hypothetical protein [Cellulomonas hominis]